MTQTSITVKTRQMIQVPKMMQTPHQAPSANLVRASITEVLLFCMTDASTEAAGAASIYAVCLQHGTILCCATT